MIQYNDHECMCVLNCSISVDIMWLQALFHKLRSVTNKSIPLYRRPATLLSLPNATILVKHKLCTLIIQLCAYNVRIVSGNRAELNFFLFRKCQTSHISGFFIQRQRDYIMMKPLSALGCNDNKVMNHEAFLYKIFLIVPIVIGNYNSTLYNKYSLLMRDIEIESPANVFLNE